MTGISKKSKNSNNKGYKQWFSLAGKKALNKKLLFFWTEKCVLYLLRWRTPWKVYDTMKENGFHYPENEFPPARISSVFKNWSQLMMSVFDSRKTLSNKVTCSTREKNPSPIAGMKGSFTNTFPLDRKKKFSLAVVPKNI